MEEIKNKKMKQSRLLTQPIGMICLAVAILMGKFLPGNNLNDFIEGFLIGISIVLNIRFIVINSTVNKRSQQ